MQKLLLTGGVGGRYKKFNDVNRYLYEEAVLVTLDTLTGEREIVFRYRSPDDAIPAAGGSHVFKAGSWDGDLLLLCTETEVLWVDPDGWNLVKRVSHGCFNDVHHVIRIDGKVRVLNTGMDAMVTLADDDETIESIESVLVDEQVWDRFDPEIDYRLQWTTKPHKAHPNFGFSWKGRVYASCCTHGTARAIGVPESGIPVIDGKIHDGLPHNGSLWFTQVDGHVIRIGDDHHTTWNLAELSGDAENLGWCRGVLPVNDHQAWVAFSAVRRSDWTENLRMLRAAMLPSKRIRPTRIELYDLQERTRLKTYDFRDLRLSAVFNILPMPA